MASTSTFAGIFDDKYTPLWPHFRAHFGDSRVTRAFVETAVAETNVGLKTSGIAVELELRCLVPTDLEEDNVEDDGDLLLKNFLQSAG